MPSISKSQYRKIRSLEADGKISHEDAEHFYKVDYDSLPDNAPKSEEFQYWETPNVAKMLQKDEAIAAIGMASPTPGATTSGNVQGVRDAPVIGGRRKDKLFRRSVPGFGDIVPSGHRRK